MLHSIAQLFVFSVILLHQKHMTKFGAAIAMTEIIHFSEIQFFYMILSISLAVIEPEQIKPALVCTEISIAYTNK